MLVGRQALSRDLRTWHHVLRDAAYETASIGKLHFRSSEDDNGFDEEILAVHVVGGVGLTYCVIRPSVATETLGDRTESGVSGVGPGRRHLPGTARR